MEPGALKILFRTFPGSVCCIKGFEIPFFAEFYERVDKL